MFASENDWTVGKAVRLRRGLLRVLAPNPSPMTWRGTNSYVLGDTTVAVIDPGPDDPNHLAALVAAIGGRPVSHIIVTHSHRDHSTLARSLAQATGGPVLAYGNSLAGRSVVMTGLAATGLVGGGEGVDVEFMPDDRLRDGQVIDGDGWTLRVVHTPGHLGNHICLRWGHMMFTGDHVMGWATSLVSPPDGDLSDFMMSCRKLARLPSGPAYPGHGPVVANTTTRIGWLVSHRLKREAQIIAALSQGHATVPELTATIYADTAPALHPAGARNVLAHLIDLHSRNIVCARPDLGVGATFALV